MPGSSLAHSWFLEDTLEESNIPPVEQFSHLFYKIYHHFSDMLVHTVLTKEDIISICNYTYVKAIRSYSHARGEASFFTYLHTCCYREVADEIKQHKRGVRFPAKQKRLELVESHNVVIDVAKINYFSAVTDDVGMLESVQEHQEEKEILETWLSYFNELEQAIIKYKVSGLTSKETAKILGVSESFISKKLKHIFEVIQHKKGGRT